jgi:hypothetical protein
MEVALRERLSRLDLELPPSAATHRQQWVLLPHRTSFAPLLALFGCFCCVDAILWVLSVVSRFALWLYLHIVDVLLLRLFVCNPGRLYLIAMHFDDMHGTSCVDVVTMQSNAIESVYDAVGVCSWLEIHWPPCVPAPRWLQMACFGLFRYQLAALWCHQRHRSVVIYHKLWSNCMTVLGI